MKIQKICMAQALLENPHGRFLIGKKIDGALASYYCFPGGHVESGETQEQTMIREVREETGIVINTSGTVLVGKIIISRKHEGKRIEVAVYHSQRLIENLTPDHGEFEKGTLKWYSPEEIMRLRTPPGEKEWMEAFFENVNTKFTHRITCGRDRTKVTKTKFTKIE